MKNCLDCHHSLSVSYARRCSSCYLLQYRHALGLGSFIFHNGLWKLAQTSLPGPLDAFALPATTWGVGEQGYDVSSYLRSARDE